MSSYIGRFAPSPTGPLHFGSLIAALASYCDAKHHQGLWLLRIEDLDKPRVIQGAAKNIINTLAMFGFQWDGEIVYQSQRKPAYEEALNALKKQNLIYPCTCSRKEIADSSSTRGIEGVIYPKTCLHQPLKKNVTPAYRIKTLTETTSFIDQIQGQIQQNIALGIGDFVLKRADGFFTYQLAVVVDDAAQGITNVVRGADLLQSTPRQIFLQQKLSFPQPHYTHFPVASNANGEKLSKQTLAKEIHTENASNQLYEALKFLGQNPPEILLKAKPSEVLAWAVAHWQINNIPQTPSIRIEKF
jgi:glutamyl-Q tRNA(Asp) synthetase